MKKEKPSSAQAYLQVPGTQYIILPDDKVARLLTPTSRPSGDTWSLNLGGKLHSKLRLEVIRGWATGDVHLPPALLKDGND